MIVADIGCAERPAAIDSILYLRERFHPEVLFGFDPAPHLEPTDTQVNGTRIRLERSAAWTRPGQVFYWENGSDSRVGEGLVNWDKTVPCFDLAEWLREHAGEEIVLKIDAEGAEYPLLEHLAATGTDKLVTALLVEWHDHAFYAEERRDALLARLHPEVEEWDG